MREAPLVDKGCMLGAYSGKHLAGPCTKERSTHIPSLPNRGHGSTFSLAFPTKCLASLSKEGREKRKPAVAGVGERPHCVGVGRAGWLFELPPPLLSQGLISPPSTKASRASIWVPLLSPAPLCTSWPPPTRCKLAKQRG